MLKVSRPLTTEVIASVVESLHEIFGHEYSFGPDPTANGGIMFFDYEDAPRGSYKSFRLLCADWPSIKPYTLLEWATGHVPTVLQKAAGAGVTKNPTSWSIMVSLKAVDGAPVWTMEEVNMFIKAFQRYGGGPYVQSVHGMNKLCKKLVEPARGDFGAVMDQDEQEEWLDGIRKFKEYTTYGPIYDELQELDKEYAGKKAAVMSRKRARIDV